MEFWQQDKLRNITPKAIPFPEGFDVLAVLSKLVGDRTVLDYGCGYGRLCPAFDPSKYIGFDINPEAINLARKNYPEYEFSYEPVKGQDVALLYTVALHINDQSIEIFLRSIGTESIIICEVMGRQWRPDKEGVPAYNRSEQEYTDIMDRLGYRLDTKLTYEYEYYKTNITFMEYTKC